MEDCGNRRGEALNEACAMGLESRGVIRERLSSQNSLIVVVPVGE